MKARITLAATAAIFVFTAPAAIAQVAYPAKGQSPETQAKDESECAAWATQQSGFDPAHPPQAAAATQAPVTGSGSRARGAAVGAAVGAAADEDAGKAAAVGAVAAGSSQRRQNRRDTSAQNQAVAQQAGAGQASYDQARGACLTGRGYTVK